ncbi:MAG: hypothetical protein KIT09_17015 [Bryobacteraceae bacterium]|nr:hypothetical protein [Bryobacteraceae bacterium]
MKRGMTLSVVAAILAIAGLSYAGWRIVHAKSLETCSVCRRSAHAPTRAIGVDGGRQTVFCCPSCARSEVRQSGGGIGLKELTDYPTQRPLEPSASYLVAGSDLTPCLHHHAHLDEHKQPLVKHFDRCTPSVIAFANRNAAIAFAREHGGRVLTFAQWWSQ